MHKAVEVPGLAADALHGLMKGQTRVNLDLHASNDLAQLPRRLVRNVVMGLCDGIADQFKHYLVITNMSLKICESRNCSDWVFICICDCDVCAYYIFFPNEFGFYSLFYGQYALQKCYKNRICTLK